MILLLTKTHNARHLEDSVVTRVPLSLFFKFLFVCLFVYIERETVQVGEGQREREGERENPMWAPTQEL